MRRALLLAFGVVAPLIGAPAHALAKDPCAAIEEPFAYNACLARHGPHALATRPIPERGEDSGALRPRRGRARLEFDLGGGRR